MDRPPTRSKQLVINDKVYINKTGWTNKYQQARNATVRTHVWYKYKSLDLRIWCQRQSSVAAATLDPSAYGFGNDTPHTRAQSLFKCFLNWGERRLGIRLRRARGLMGREEGQNSVAIFRGKFADKSADFAKSTQFLIYLLNCVWFCFV